MSRGGARGTVIVGNRELLQVGDGALPCVLVRLLIQVNELLRLRVIDVADLILQFLVAGFDGGKLFLMLLRQFAGLHRCSKLGNLSLQRGVLLLVRFDELPR